MKIYHIPDTLEHVLFDIDNTLYRHDEYQKLQVDLLVKRFARLQSIDEIEAQRRIDSARTAAAAEGGTSTTSLGNAMQFLGIPLQENAKWRSELFHPEQFLVPDIALQDCIRTLEASYILHAVTNNSREIGDRTLAALGIRTYFSETIGLETVGASKPSAELFKWALHRSGCQAKRALSIGDRYEVDIVPALNMGIGGLLVETMEDVYLLPDVLNQSSKS